MIKKDLFHPLPDTISPSFDPITKNADYLAKELSVTMVDASGIRSAIRSYFALHFWGLCHI